MNQFQFKDLGNKVYYAGFCYIFSITTLYPLKILISHA